MTPGAFYHCADKSVCIPTQRSPCHSGCQLGAVQHLSELSEILGSGPTLHLRTEFLLPPRHSSTTAAPGASPEFGVLPVKEFPHCPSRNLSAAAIPASISPAGVPSPVPSPEHRAEQPKVSQQLLSWTWGRTWKPKVTHRIMESFGRLKIHLTPPLPWAGLLPLGQGEDPVQDFLLHDGTEEGEAPKKPKTFIPEERNP